MKLFNKKSKVKVPATSHQPLSQSNIHAVSNPTEDVAKILSVKIEFEDNCTIENLSPKLVSIPLPNVPSFDYGIDFDNFDKQNGTDDQEIPFRTASFKPFVLISNVLESNLESKKYTLASVKLKVYPSQLIKGDADWYNDAELKQYIEEQWSQVFNEISDAYNLGSQVKYPVNMMSGQNYHPVGSAAIPATPRTYTMFGYTFTPIQLVLMVITAILLIYVALALANKYSSNNQTASGQNLYSNASIDKQVQIAEDVVAKVQDRMGVPKLAQSDLGCLQEVN
ncbi:MULTISPECIES: hypothetical protein [Acinetobacter]|uniref:Uncharacterized protein n=1 Tax=Acinetobacter corruptisaponis TaxID=3045147 RepID=A0ABY8S808_9GAMM|nr:MULTISPECIES: hypothetical protein [Acinetobacter]EJB8578110.1 hypothetical protein [Acinetobacter baumannii]WHP07817.1 hypothetical protein QLH32_18770 [Acinetobacter sp. KCTC 92772]WHP07870.1 hypothetical protein QLH32_19055 [Acinetobacter sp. KCTC 92772]